jgi:stearoyl-CoA desaturase (delta-9 desaturase)
MLNRADSIESLSVRGVFSLNAKAKRRARTITLLTVCMPLMGFVVAVFSGWLRHISATDVIALTSLYFLTTLGITLGFHRLFSHRAFRTSRIVETTLIIFGSMAAQGPLLSWVAIHRRHHTYSDRDGDPHTPNRGEQKERAYFEGVWHAHVGWLFKHEMTNTRIYASDLLKNKLVVRMSQPDYYLGSVMAGLLLPAIACGLASMTWMGAVRGLVWGGLVRLFLVHHATWSINSICHLFGSRPFPSRDSSGNVSWLSLFTLGESWHNNHHAFPRSAYHGLRWWQMDLTGCIVFALAAVGLVWDVQIPLRQEGQLTQRGAAPGSSRSIAGRARSRS